MAANSGLLVLSAVCGSASSGVGRERSSRSILRIVRPLTISCLIVAVVSCGSKQPGEIGSPSQPRADGDAEPGATEAAAPLVIVPHDKELQVLELGGELVARLPVIEVQSAVAVSADGRLIAAGRGFAPAKNGWTEDGTIWLWNVDDEMAGGAELSPDSVLEGHKREMVVALGFTADGTKLMSAGDRGRLLLWDVASGKVSREWKIPYASTASMSPDGRWFVTHHLDGVRLWSTDRDKAVKLDVPKTCMDSAFAPESNRFAVVCKNVVYEFEPPSTKPVRELETELSFGRGITYSSKHLASLYKEKQAIVWDRDTGEVAAKVEFGPASLDDAYRLVFDTRGQVLGAAYCNEVRGYDLTAKSSVFSFSSKPARCRPALAFVPR